MQGNSLDQCKALVLNSYYEPIRIVAWQRAMLLMFGEKVDVLETYTNSFVHSVSQNFAVPAVVRLRGFGRVKNKVLRIKFCREHVFVRDDYLCQYCHKEFPPRELTLDHVMPAYRGGKTSWTNVVSCCKRCNQRKGGRTPDEAGFNLLKKPIMPKVNQTMPDLFVYKRLEIPPIWKQYFASVV
ncbi:HNH endonuclease [bacterium]|nr:HNH endonuclease [bacterium]